MSKIYKIILVPLILISIGSKGQEYNTIQSIDPQNKNFSDLMFLKEILKEKRIIALGDNVHGDASGNLAKIRLIEFLHEEMGFDVLAFESGYYGVKQAWNDTVKYSEAVKHRYYGVFSYCEEMLSLWNYIDSNRFRKNKKLIVEGFDIQSFDFFGLEQDLRKRINDTSIATNIGIYGKIVLDSLMRNNKVSTNKTATKLINKLRECQKDLKKDTEYDEWMFVIENQIQYVNSLIIGENSIEGRNMRDSLMASNIEYIVNEKYPQEKIIIWASNGHIAKSFKGVSWMKYFKPMGEYLENKFSDDLFVITWTAGTGKTFFTCSEEGIKIKPKRNSIEYKMIKRGVNYAFIPSIKNRGISTFF